MTSPLRILILDDDPGDLALVREALRRGLTDTEVQFVDATTIEEAEVALAEGVDVALFDHRLGLDTGLDLLKRQSRHGLPCPVIMLSGVADTSIAVEAMKAGASDYLPKSSISPEVAALTLRRTLARDLEARKRRQVEREYDRLRGVYEVVLEGSADGIVGMDADGRIRFVNPSACTMIGTSERALIGRPFDEVIHADEEQRRGGPCQVCRTLRAGQPMDAVETDIVRADGFTVPVRLSLNALGRVRDRGFVALVSDVSSERLAHEARELANDRMREMEHRATQRQITRDITAAMARHLEPALDAADRQHSLGVEGRRVRFLAAGLADAARLQFGEDAVPRSEFDIVSAIRAEVHARGLSMPGRPPESILVHGEPTRMRAALGRLLDLAADTGPPTWTLRAIGKQAAQVVIPVPDRDGVRRSIEEAMSRPIRHLFQPITMPAITVDVLVCRALLAQQDAHIAIEDGNDEAGFQLTVLTMDPDHDMRVRTPDAP